jgi:hypothetical protein
MTVNGYLHPGGPAVGWIHRVKTPGLAILGAALIFGVTACPASASRSLTVDSAARAYDKALASANEPSAVVEGASGESLFTTSADASGGVTIGSGVDAVHVVPAASAARSAKVSLGAGSSLYRGATAKTSTIVDPVGTGVRLATVTTDDSRDEQTFRYQLGLPAGASASRTADGAVKIARADGSALVSIAAPWAKDANGKSLPTSYTISGSTLLQTVQTRGAAFPVVADPRIERTGPLGLTGVRIWFTRKETESLYRQKTQITTGAGLANIACGFLSGPLSPICLAVVDVTLGDFLVNIDEAHRDNHCINLEIRLVPPPPGLPDWDDGDGEYCEHP